MPGPKPGSTPRRVSSSLSKVSTPPATTTTPTPARTTKSSSKPAKIVHIKLPKEKLLRFPHEQQLRKASHAKASPLSTAKVITPDEPATIAAVKAEPDTTSASSRSKGSSSPTKDTNPDKPTTSKTGLKRELGAGVEEEDKDTTKTNPRKRPKA